MRPINFRFQVYNPTSVKITEIPRSISNLVLGNLVNCHPFAFRFSQVVERMFEFYQTGVSTDDEYLNFESFDTSVDKPYIFATAVGYNPHDWTDMGYDGEIDPSKKSVFEYLPDKLLHDLRQGKALLLLDQSVEGYGHELLWKWFHEKCSSFQLNPACIIYTTGDQSCFDSYTKWFNENIKDGSKVHVVPSTSLFFYVKRRYEKENVQISFDETFSHKQKITPKYLFDCFMFRPRDHRILTFLHLLASNLLEYGNIGMSDKSEWYPYAKGHPLFLNYGLPSDIMQKLDTVQTFRKIEHDDDETNYRFCDFAERVFVSMYRSSWVTIVVEPTFFKGSPIFISEKSLKPIACMQPFLIVGSSGSLKYLRKLGFKTFHPFINEAYDDEEDDGKRLLLIMEELKKIKEHNRLEWFSSMREIVEHNHNIFMSLNSKKSEEHHAIINYYFEYFKEKYVS